MHRHLTSFPTFGRVMAEAAGRSKAELAQMPAADLERLRQTAAQDLRASLPKVGTDG